MEDPQGPLEQAFIEEYLRWRGCDAAQLVRLPEDSRRRLLKEASIYAAMKLADVESKARYIHELHDGH